MIKIHVKNCLVLSLFTVSLNTHAALIDKAGIAQHCHDLSENIISLLSSQVKSSCVEKLSNASFKINIAADLIANNSTKSAKKELEEAISSLQYAELNNCNRYIQIVHSKFEAIKIRNSF